MSLLEFGNWGTFLAELYLVEPVSLIADRFSLLPETLRLRPERIWVTAREARMRLPE